MGLHGTLMLKSACREICLKSLRVTRGMRKDDELRVVGAGDLHLTRTHADVLMPHEKISHPACSLP